MGLLFRNNRRHVFSRFTGKILHNKLYILNIHIICNIYVTVPTTKSLHFFIGFLDVLGPENIFRSG